MLHAHKQRIVCDKHGSSDASFSSDGPLDREVRNEGSRRSAITRIPTWDPPLSSLNMSLFSMQWDAIVLLCCPCSVLAWSANKYLHRWLMCTPCLALYASMISRHLVFTWRQLLVVESQTSDFSGNNRRLGERRIFYTRDDTKRANKDSNNRPGRHSPGWRCWKSWDQQQRIVVAQNVAR